jgi:hypothetical protein
MKKSIIVALVCFFGLTQMNAQTTFKPGFRAGVNFSKLTQTNSVSKTDYYVGGFGALKISKFYTLQPEISYTRQGAKDVATATTIGTYDNNGYPINSVIISKEDVETAYISLGIINKFNFTEKLSVIVGPSVDFLTEGNTGSNRDFSDTLFPQIDIAFTAGVGFTVFKNFTVEARIKKGLIDVYDKGDDSNYSYYSDDRSYVTNFLYQVGATYAFDLK